MYTSVTKKRISRIVGNHSPQLHHMPKNLYRKPTFINKKQRQMKHALILFLLSMFALNLAHAKKIHVADTIKNTAIAENEVMDVRETNTSIDYECKSFVKLSFVDGYHPTESDFPVEVEYLLNGSGPYMLSLTDEGTYFKETDIEQMDWLYTVNVRILNVSGNVSNVQLIGGINIQRAIPLDLTEKPNSRGTVSFLDSRNEYLVYWDEMEGAEEYQLEWAYIDNYSEDGDNLEASAVTVPHDLFRSNSTRISTTKTSYTIPVIYEAGFVLYRVRAVGILSKTHYETYVFGAWSNEDRTGVLVSDFDNEIGNNNYFEIDGISTGLNWQASTVFAEEGKRNTSISYFDGTKRQRQAVTKLSTQDEAIVGEVYYDVFGREAIQVLPVPTNDASIEYYKNFNLKDDGGDGAKITPLDLIDNESELNCTPYGMKLSTKTGASKYYSPNNDSVDVGYNSLIPDAKGYPYVQIEYTPDNTGRVKTKTGVGEQFILGSGHETKYEYGAPTQEELDAFFGTEAGYSAHYKKIVSVDPNGQATISLQDMQGNTVATSTSGSSPANMDGLNIDSKTITSTLLNANVEQDIDLAAMTKTFHKEVVLDKNSDIAISYNITPNEFKLGCTSGALPALILDGEGICMNCVLDVEIRITDKCGNSIALDPQNTDLDADNIIVGSEIITAIENGSYTTCQSNPMVAFSATTDQLNVGTYTISKTTKINQQAYDYFLNQFLDPDRVNCLETYDEKYNRALETFAGYNCVWTCEECMAKFPDTYELFLQTLEEDEEVPVDEAGYQDYIKAQCADYCDMSVQYCENIYDAMLADVSPMGQYAEFELTFDDEGNGIYDVDTPLSVFNIENKLAPEETMQYNWKNPHFIGKNYLPRNPFGYFLTNGQFDTPITATVNVFYDGTSAVPEVEQEYIDNNFFAAGYYKVPPKHLVKVEDFIAAWEEPWAHSLVMYHPEYDNYQVCVNMAHYYSFDQQLMEIEKLEDANPAMVNDPLSIDPLVTNYTGGPNEQVYTLMTLFLNLDFYDPLDELDDSYTIWELAYKLANCPEAGGDYAGPCSVDCLEEFNNSTLSYYDRFLNSPNDVWPIYSSLYRSLRQTVEEFLFVRRSIEAEAYNGCFNTENFNQDANSFSSFEKYLTQSDPISQYENVNQPCSEERHELFKTKTPRFFQPRNVDGTKDEEEGEQVDVCGDNNQYMEYLENEGSIDINTMSEADKGSLRNMGCAESREMAVKMGKIRNNVRYIETCGECPISLFMRDFFKELHEKGGFGNGYVSALNCSPDGIPIYFTTELIEKSGLPTNYEHRWGYERQEGQKYYYRLIANANFKRFVIALPEGYTWDDVEDFCCIEYMRDGYDYKYLSEAEFNENPDTRFKVGLIMKQDEGLPKKVMSEGYTDTYILNDCPYMYCTRNPLGFAIIRLLNSLALNVDDDGDKKLVGSYSISKNINNSIDKEAHYISSIILDRLGKDPNSFEVIYDGYGNSESKFSMTLAASSSSSNFGVDLYPEPGVTIDYTKIKRIVYYEGINHQKMTLKIFDLDGNAYYVTMTITGTDDIMNCKSYNYGNN